MQNEQVTTNQSNVGQPNVGQPNVGGKNNERQSQDPNRDTATVRQQGNDLKEEIKDQASHAAHEVREQTKQISHQVQQNATELASQAKSKATETLSDAKRQVETQTDARKGEVADRLHGVAAALRDTSNKLQEQDEAVFADYASSAADQVERFSGYLREQSVGDLVNDVQHFARRQPELFLAGALAAGFMLGRFFKSSERSQTHTTQQRYDTRSYPSQGANAGEVYGAYGSPSYADPYAQSQYDQGRYGQSGYRQGEYYPQTNPYGQSGYNRSGAGVTSTPEVTNTTSSYSPQTQNSDVQADRYAQAAQEQQEKQEKSEAQR